MITIYTTDTNVSNYTLKAEVTTVNSSPLLVHMPDSQNKSMIISTDRQNCAALLLLCADLQNVSFYMSCSKAKHLNSGMCTNKNWLKTESTDTTRIFLNCKCDQDMESQSLLDKTSALQLFYLLQDNIYSIFLNNYWLRKYPCIPVSWIYPLMHNNVVLVIFLISNFT